MSRMKGSFLIISSKWFVPNTMSFAIVYLEDSHSVIDTIAHTM